MSAALTLMQQPEFAFLTAMPAQASLSPGLGLKRWGVGADFPAYYFLP